MAVLELNQQNFESVITGHDFVIVDYWSPTCGPCRAFAPVFEKLAEEHPDLLFATANTLQEPEIAAHFAIRAVPTLMIIRDQAIVFNQAGAPSELAFRDLIHKAINLDMEKLRAENAETEWSA